MPVREGDLELTPERIEAVPLNRIEHGDEWLAPGQARIRPEYLVDGRIVGDCGCLRLGRKFGEIDRKLVPVVVRGHIRATTVGRRRSGQGWAADAESGCGE